MADRKISELPAATLPLEGTEDIPLVQGGESRQANLSDVRDAALRAEVEAARGSRSSLGLRIDTISNFASPNAGGVVVGRYYDNAFHSASGANLTGAVGRTDLSPYYTSVPLRIDEIGVLVGTAVAGALGRCCIYGSDANGWPDALLYEGPSNLDYSTTGFKAHSLDFTFESGRQYWLGHIHSSNAQLRSVPIASMVNLGISSGGATAYDTVLRRTLTFANPLPSSWGFISSDLASSNGTNSIRMRAAAL